MKKKSRKAGIGERIKNWIRRHPFTVAAVCLTVLMLLLAVRLPGLMRTIERQTAEIETLREVYRKKQEESNLLNSELALIDTPAFIEKLARREHGFGWYGETIYEIGNLGNLEEVTPESTPQGGQEDMLEEEPSAPTE